MEWTLDFVSLQNFYIHTKARTQKMENGKLKKLNLSILK